MLRIAFAGTPEFALPALRALAASRHQLVGVLTQPDRPAGRGTAGAPRELKSSPVKRLAQQLGVPIVPVTLAGSFEHFRTGHWMLRPGVVTIVLHDTIETAMMTKEDVPALRERVREIVASGFEMR